MKFPREVVSRLHLSDLLLCAAVVVVLLRPAWPVVAVVAVLSFLAAAVRWLRRDTGLLEEVKDLRDRVVRLQNRVGG